MATRILMFVFLLTALACGDTVPTSPAPLTTAPALPTPMPAPPPPAPAPANYAGTWTGRHTITNCHDLDPDPRLTHLGLCATMNPDASYRFMLSQSGTTVTGPYTITRALVSTPCACAGMISRGFDMSGTIAPDGSLQLSGAGSLIGVGLQVVMTFNLKPVTSPPLVGTVSGELDFGGFQRATFDGEMLP